MELYRHPKLAGDRTFCCGLIGSAKIGTMCKRCGAVWNGGGETVAADAPKTKRARKPKAQPDATSPAVPKSPRKAAGLIEKQSAKRDAAKARKVGLGEGVNQ